MRPAAGSIPASPAPATTWPRTARHRPARRPPRARTAPRRRQPGQRSGARPRHRIGYGVDPGRQVDERFRRAGKQPPRGAEIAAVKQAVRPQPVGDIGTHVRRARASRHAVRARRSVIRIGWCARSASCDLDGSPDRRARAAAQPRDGRPHTRRAVGILRLCFSLSSSVARVRLAATDSCAACLRILGVALLASTLARATQSAPACARASPPRSNASGWTAARRRRAYRRPRSAERSTRPASRAPRSKAWRRTSPTASSRRLSGWRSAGLPGGAPTRRSTPPTA